MASAVSKRSQARNERALQDLIRTVPGNDRCADCFARNPGWASWSLGIFLCMRCAALHRKLGTHISKVKSLSMDSWSDDQVKHMKKTGNIASNRLYNPKSVKPNIPIDADEIDGVIERFIREKYQNKTLSDGPAKPSHRQNTGLSGSSVDDIPPQVPPKSPRFGASLRAASSTYPSRQADPLPDLPQRQEGDNKLKTLRDMGFQDDSKNAQILRGAGGDVGKAVEILVRLGEGGPAAQQRFQAANRSREIQVPVRADSEPRLSSVQPQQQVAPSATPANYSTTSVGQTSAGQRQQQQQVQQVQQQQQQQQQNPYNPFQTVSQPESHRAALDQAFSNMTLSTPQSLNPQNTGSWTTGSAGASTPQTNPFLRTFTPPMSPNPYQSAGLQQTLYQNQYQPQPTSMYNTPQPPSNPFLRTSKSMNFASSNPFGQPQQNMGVQQQAYYQQHQKPAYLDDQSIFGQQSQPFQQQASPGMPYQSQAPQAGPPGSAVSAYYSQQQSPYVQSPAPLEQHPTSPPLFDQAFQQHNQQNTYPPPSGSYQPYSAPADQQQYQQPAQPLYPQATGRYDKSSILALYNAPHLAPQRLEPLQENMTSQGQEAASTPGQQPNGPPQRSFTAPVAQTQNPFAKLMPNGPRSTVNRDSVDFQGLTNGRHSPDAFRSLSARIA